MGGAAGDALSLALGGLLIAAALEAPAARAQVPPAASDPLQAPAAPGPDTSASPTPAAAPVDPALTQPLVPLDQFRLQAQTPTGPPPQAPKQIRYTVKIEGLRSIGLQGRFQDLSSLQRGKGRAEDEAQVRARADEDTELIGRLLRSDGYFDGSVQAQVTPAPTSGGAVAVALTVTPGGRYDFGEIVVTGPPTRPPGLARQALTLSPGEPILSSSVVAAETQVGLKLPEHGYPFVSVGQRDITLDPQTHTGAYALPVNPGPRSSFGRFVISGQQVFSPDHLKVIARFRQGQLYDSRLVDDLRKALVASQLYGELGIEPVKTDRPGPDGTTQADLSIRGSKGQSHTLSASAGYDTGIGPMLTLSWSALNILPPEGALTLSGTGGTQRQQASVGFVRSNFGQRDRALTATIQATRETISAYNAETGEITFGISRQSTPIWQKRWTYSALVDGMVTSEAAYDIFAHASERKLYKIVSLPLELEYDGSDNLYNPTRGFRVIGHLAPEVSIQKGASEYVRGVIEADGYLHVAKPLVLAGRFQLASILGAPWYDLAPTRRLYAGGGASIGQVRGYAYQSLGPKDPSNNALGGAALTDFSAEARYRFGDYGVVAFLDGGQAYQSTIPRFSNMRYGVGVGFRYYTSIGPMRIDVATPLSRHPGEGVIGVYVSIGQAF